MIVFKKGQSRTQKTREQTLENPHRIWTFGTRIPLKVDFGESTVEKNITNIYRWANGDLNKSMLYELIAKQKNFLSKMRNCKHSPTTRAKTSLSVTTLSPKPCYI